MTAADTGGLFSPNLYAEDLLEKSPEYLLARGDITDWAGRTFKNITAFEYAVWAQDFKMVEMMLKHATPEIKVDLLKQLEQVTKPVSDGGGLSYTLTYQRPDVDPKDVPTKDAAGNWQNTTVHEARRENHSLSILHYTAAVA